MAPKDEQTLPQITIGNSVAPLIHIVEDLPDGLHWWAEQYFRFEVTTSRRTDGSPGRVDATTLAGFSAAFTAYRQ